jgi:hypothetical protein
MGYISINIIIFMEKGIFSFSGFFLFKILTFFAKSPKPFFYVLLCIGHLFSVEFSVSSPYACIYAPRRKDVPHVLVNSNINMCHSIDLSSS